MAKFTSETAKEAGQKSKRGQNKLMVAIKEAADKDKAIKIFSQLETQALAGDLDAIRLYLSYLVGKPKEAVDITTDGEKVTGLIVEVIRREQTNSKD